MMDQQQLEQAEKHIKNAWIAGAASAAITFVFSLIGAYNETIRFKYGLDTWSLLDVALIAGLAYGIYNKNRFCALAMLIYFIASKFIMAATTGEFTGGFLVLLSAYFFFQGTRATFQLRKHLVQTGEIVVQEKKKGLGYYALVVSGVFILLVFVGLLVIGISAPEIEVVPGKQLKKKYASFVLEKGILAPSEEIQYWYSDGFMDFEEGFYLFTDKKVVIYSKSWADPLITVPFSEITDIEFEQDPSFIDDSRITLFLKDSSTVYFPVSSENGGDTRYYQRLRELWATSAGYIN